MPILDQVLNVCTLPNAIETFLDSILYDEDYTDGFITGPNKSGDSSKTEDRIGGRFSNKTLKVTVDWPTTQELGIDTAATASTIQHLGIDAAPTIDNLASFELAQIKQHCNRG